MNAHDLLPHDIQYVYDLLSAGFSGHSIASALGVNIPSVYYVRDNTFARYTGGPNLSYDHLRLLRLYSPCRSSTADVRMILDYANRQARMIDDANVPVIVGELVKAWTEGSPSGHALLLNAAIERFGGQQ